MHFVGHLFVVSAIFGLAACAVAPVGSSTVHANAERGGSPPPTTSSPSASICINSADTECEYPLCPVGTFIDESAAGPGQCNGDHNAGMIEGAGQIKGICLTYNDRKYACKVMEGMCPNGVKTITTEFVQCVTKVPDVYSRQDISPEVFRSRAKAAIARVNVDNLRWCRGSVRTHCAIYKQMRETVFEAFPESVFDRLRASLDEIAPLPPNECGSQPNVGNWCKERGGFMASCADRMARLLAELDQLSKARTRTITLASAPGATVKLSPKINVLPDRVFTTDVTLDAYLGQYDVRFEMQNRKPCVTDVDLRQEHIQKLECTWEAISDDCKCLRK
jgi:hypothetical protein